jgi:hypothetical protein
MTVEEAKIFSAPEKSEKPLEIVINNESSESYSITKDDLIRIVDFDKRDSSDHIDNVLFKEFNGPMGILKQLKTDFYRGLSSGAIDTVTSPSKNEGDPVRVDRAIRRNSSYNGPTLGGGGKVSLNKSPSGPPLSVETITYRRAQFGSNLIIPPKPKTILQLIWETIKDDHIVKLLLICFVVVLGLGTPPDPKKGWIEGTAILVAVVIVLVNNSIVHSFRLL